MTALALAGGGTLAAVRWRMEFDPVVPGLTPSQMAAMGAVGAGLAVMISLAALGEALGVILGDLLISHLVAAAVAAAAAGPVAGTIAISAITLTALGVAVVAVIGGTWASVYATQAFLNAVNIQTTRGIDVGFGPGAPAYSGGFGDGGVDGGSPAPGISPGFGGQLGLDLSLSPAGPIGDGAAQSGAPDGGPSDGTVGCCTGDIGIYMVIDPGAVLPQPVPSAPGWFLVYLIMAGAIAWRWIFPR